MYENSGNETPFMTYTSKKNADFGELMCMSAELGLDKFGIGINVDLHSNKYEMSVMATNNLQKASIEFHDSLNPKRNDMLNDTRMFEEYNLHPEYWEENPKIQFLRSYMEDVKKEIKNAMPFSVKVYKYVKPSILHLCSIVNKD